MSKLIASMFFTLAMGVTACTTDSQTKIPMKTSNLSLWQLIEMLGNQPSLLPDKIKQVLPIAFVKSDHIGHTSFYDGDRLLLRDQIDIEAVELRVRNEDETRGMVSLDLDPSGACVTFDDVRGRFPGLVLTDYPRGQSLDEEASWSIQRSWGKLSFGFKERNPDCLATVVLDRSDPPPERG